jgi:hypothetical protein
MRLTKRGRIVLIYAPAAFALIALIIWISGNIWWTGEGYCIGSMAECLGKEFTR